MIDYIKNEYILKDLEKINETSDIDQITPNFKSFIKLIIFQFKKKMKIQLMGRIKRK